MSGAEAWAMTAALCAGAAMVWSIWSLFDISSLRRELSESRRATRELSQQVAMLRSDIHAQMEHGRTGDS